MKTIFTYFLLLTSAIVFAQPVLTLENNAPQIGETYSSSATLDYFPILPGGPDAVWDFSNLIPVSNNQGQPIVLTYSYSALSDAPYAADFPDGDIVETCDFCASSTIYRSESFGKVSTGQHTTIINNGQEIDWSQFYFEHFLRYPYPFTYGDQFTEQFSGESLFFGYNMQHEGDVTVEADGFGTIILPWGSISNVLRIHTTKFELQNIPNFLPAYAYFDIYEYYAPGIRFPIIRATRDTEVDENGNELSVYQEYVNWLNPLGTGCNNPLACNYNPLSGVDDGSCIIIGSPCDDGLAETVNDVITSDCMCAGEVVLAAGCTMPDACNFDATATVDDGSCYFVSDPCDDGNPGTIDDIYNADCICEGIIVSISGCTDAAACNFVPEATEEDGSCLYVGSPCDDGLAETINDIIDFDCMCVGEFTIVAGCMLPEACNYNMAATVDDGSCIFIGDPCDDGNADTFGDVYNAACECEGLVSVTEINTFSALYPNPATDKVYVTFNNSTPDRIEIYDMRGTLVASESKTRNIAVIGLATGIYTVKLTLGEDMLMQRLEIIH